MDVLTEWLIRGVEVGEEADEGKDGEKDGEGAVSRRDESGPLCFLWRGGFPLAYRAHPVLAGRL